MKIKRVIAICMTTMLAFSCAACGKTKENVNATTETKVDESKAEETIAFADGKAAEDSATSDAAVIKDYFTIETVKDSDEVDSEDGSIQYIITEESYVNVSCEAAPEVADKINTSIKELILAPYNADKDEYTEYSKEDYEDRIQYSEEEDLEMFWSPYMRGIECSILRNDSKVLSICVLNSYYMGGAHPDSVVSYYNFDSTTGEVLDLAAISKDGSEETVKSAFDAIIAEKAAAINEDYKNNEGEGDWGLFFDGYEEYIGDILTNTTWAFTENGIVISANEYIIAPHATGLIDFDIPYQDCDVIVDDYKL